VPFALLVAVVGLLSSVALPAFAWSSSPGPTTLNASTIVKGGSVTDSALIVLSNYGPGTSPSTCPKGSTFGCIIFKVYGGTCSSYSTSTLYFTSTVVVTSAAESSTFPSGGHTYASPTFTPTSTTQLSYVWIDSYTGTTGGYPSAKFACEPFTVSHGVPEFPVGMPLLIALALPALILLRRRLPQA